MNRRLVVVLLVSLVALGGGVIAAEATGARAVARAAEVFYQALNHDVGLRRSALGELRIAVAVAPHDAGTNLRLGLAHLWIAAEGDRTDAALIEHIVLSEHYLRRAQQLNPSDQRIASWLIPMQITLAGIEGDTARRRELYEQMLAEYRKDPNFHSFALAMLGFHSPQESEEFQRGLRALRATEDCDADDPSCRNDPRWPHNQEGFLLMVADYELRAGNRDQALTQLRNIQQAPGYSTWRFQEEVEHRLANLDDYVERWSNDDPGDDPEAPLVRSKVQCQMCHMN